MPKTRKELLPLYHVIRDIVGAPPRAKVMITEGGMKPSLMGGDAHFISCPKHPFGAWACKTCVYVHTDLRVVVGKGWLREFLGAQCVKKLGLV